MPSVSIGRDYQTGQDIRIGDIERRSGLYILGRPGTGKSTLMVSMMIQDIANGHGVFFLDPHGDMITELIIRIETDRPLHHIVGQRETTIDLASMLANQEIVLLTFPVTLPPDIQRSIGTRFLSQLVDAVRNRLEDKRNHFCIFVDEFQNFASSDDFAILFTQARKYAIATTIAHQERYGQFADNKRISGAIDAAGNKVFFQLSIRDAQELAPEFAETPTQERTQADMIHEKAVELAGLPLRTAYAKVLQERDQKQIVLKWKMQTLPLPPA